VLERGHNPHDYSEYLIGLARSVERAGTRITVCGTAIGGSSLLRRIRRIIEGIQRGSLTRQGGLGGGTLRGSPGGVHSLQSWNAPKARTGPADHAELSAGRTEKGREESRKYETLIEEARRLTRRNRQGLARQVKADPQDRDKILSW